MEIIEVQDLTDLKGFLHLEDHYHFFAKTDRSDWVQWLYKEIGKKNPNIKMWVGKDEDSIVAYIVAMLVVNPPLANCVHIAFCYSPHSMEETEKLVYAVENWAKECGVPSIYATILQDSSETMTMLGYNFDQFITMVKKL